MAEIIHKPKRFSKEWFSYVWDYYKVHIICVLVGLFLLFITYNDYKNTVRYDLDVQFIAGGVIPSEIAEEIARKSEIFIRDIDENGEKNVSFNQLNFTLDAIADGNTAMTLENKLASVLASEDQMFYIFDTMMLNDVVNMNAAEGIFLPVETYFTTEDTNISFFECDGVNCAVSLKDSTILRELNIDASDLYVAVRMNYDEADEDLKKRHENAVLLANALAK